MSEEDVKTEPKQDVKKQTKVQELCAALFGEFEVVKTEIILL